MKTDDQVSDLSMFLLSCNFLGYDVHFLKKHVCFFRRWLCYCQVPVFCDSLQKYDPTAVFGRVLLRSVFSVMRRQLMEKFRAERDKMPPDKRTIVLTHFPRLVCQAFY